MNRTVRIGALAAAFGLSLSATTACSFLQTAVKTVGGLSGTIQGNIKDPNGAAITDATVKVYDRSSVSNYTTPDAKGNLIVDFQKLTQASASAATTTDANGHYAFNGLKVTDAPFVIVAQNKAGIDFRGIKRDTKELFGTADVANLKNFNFSSVSVIGVSPTGPSEVDMTLPNDTPPATPPTPAPTPVIPTPAPTPTNAATPTPGSPDDLKIHSKLPLPTPGTNVTFGALAATAEDSSGKPAAAPGNSSKTGTNGFVVYDMSNLQDVTVSNKVLLNCTVQTGTLTTATLRISHVRVDANGNPTGDATITEQQVNFSGGNLVSDNPNGYELAIPRDGQETIVQVVDKTSGATSNSLAFNTYGIDPSKIRPVTIILTWDKGAAPLPAGQTSALGRNCDPSDPNRTDVDLHTFDLDSSEHAWFANLSIDNNTGSLDLDNQCGFGPETFTGGASDYGVSINLWYGQTQPHPTVRIITASTDVSFTGPALNNPGTWWDVAKINKDGTIQGLQ